ncbi:MAG TPA: ABC transporter permease [Gemmatimonadaceae bacterium]
MIRPGVKRLFRLALRRRDVVHESVEAEIALHIDLRAKQLEAQGLAPDDALREARRRFGDSPAARRSLRSSAQHRESHMRIREWLDDLRQDVRFSARSLWNHRVASTFVVLTFALGIGVNATMFGVVDTLMFRPPAGVADPDGVVRLYYSFPKPGGGGYSATQITGFGTYEAIRDNARAFQDVAAYWANETSIGNGETARPLHAVLVTASFFRALGTHPELGRFFRPDEERAEGTKTVVLGYGLWKDRFDGDRAVLGRTVDIGGQPYTVIGVSPRGFTGLDLKRVDAWLPIGAATAMFSPSALSHLSSFWLSTLARIRPGASWSVAAAEATAAFAVEHAKEPYTKGARVVLAPLPVGRGPTVSADTKVALWLGAVSVLVLLVACANVANLLLARAASRSHEIAVRLSLGAGRWRIARQLLTESMMLAAVGGVVALLLTAWTAAVVRGLVIPDVAVSSAVSWPVLGFAGAAAVATGLLCGLAPAAVGFRSDLNAALAGRAHAPAGRFRTQRTLVAVQVAFTVLLLAGAGLFVRSLAKVRNKDLGMDVRHLLYASVDFRSAGLSQADALAAYSEMLARVRTVPGVTAASISIGEPFRSGWGTWIVPKTGAAAAVKQPDFAPMGRAVSAGFFTATGRRFIAGRPFDAAEHRASAHVAIIDEAAAKYYWGNANPVGACIGTDRGPKTDSRREPCMTIVGVVADSPQWQITAAPIQELYVPIESEASDPFGVSAMEVRTAGDPAAMAARVRGAMQSAGPNVPYPSVTPLTDILDPQYRSWTLGADMFGAFGLLALVLAAVGLYGVLSYAVVQRTRELGIRSALGAQRSDLVRMIVVSGIGTAAAGAAVGVAGALGAGRFIASLLYHVSPRDPASLGAAAVVLLFVAGAASYLPARRAARVDPMTALRTD